MLHIIGQPDSVCHQWSMAGTGICSRYHSKVATSQRSPAKNCVRKLDKSYCLINSPFGSSFLMARIAVGAVNIILTLCSAITLQNVLASGVLIGFPSKITVVFLLINGP